MDLSFAIVHSARDLANGFIVAEILSRYYPNTITMHSYEAGTQLRIKRDNWDLLYNFFKKHSMEISKTDFEGVIHVVPGAAVAFLMKL